MQELEDRFSAMSARVGALELLVEALLADRIAKSPAFRTKIEIDLSVDEIMTDLPSVPDEAMRVRVGLIAETLADRLASARRLSPRYA